jgi:hypothetical protein
MAKYLTKKYIARYKTYAGKIVNITDPEKIKLWDMLASRHRPESPVKLKVKQ